MESIFYFAEVFDSAKFVSQALGTAIGIIAFILIVLSFCLDLDEDERIVINKARKLTTIITVIFIVIAIVCPSKQAFIFMMVGKCVDDTVMSNLEVKELPENAILLINEYVKRELKEKEDE